MTDSPLTKVDIKVASEGCYECDLVEREIERATACGLDCQEQQLRATHLKEFFQKVLEQYKPLVSPSKDRG